MVAAENDALKGAKVGGIGDVVRDVPPALAALGCEVEVVTPGYGFLASVAGASLVATYAVPFGGGMQTVTLWQVPGRTEVANVRHWVVEHPWMDHRGRIYCDDPPEAPFATDATKFALFSAAVAEGVVLGHFGALPDVLHLHDWHAAFIAILRRFDNRYAALRGQRCVLTLHNIAMQGVRPLRDHASSLAAWFPYLPYDPQVIADRRWPDCVNPMAAGIRLADAVHAVSPTYAREILLPSDVAQGRYGGEGLEPDLQQADAQGRLFGILNGCEYKTASTRSSPGPEWTPLLTAARNELLRWSARESTLSTANFIALARLDDWLRDGHRPATVLTSVGRVTDQKARLLLQPASNGLLAIDNLLLELADTDKHGVLLALGSGDPAYEHALVAASGRHANFIFLRGYSELLADMLYAAGDLFLMPSSFEPCGISQMLAMRNGQPCLVHGVGGLKDTVADGVDGFVFEAHSPTAQADALVATLARALALRSRKAAWTKIRRAALAARFPWETSARAYIEKLYRPAAVETTTS
jgi:starch synthase